MGPTRTVGECGRSIARPAHRAGGIAAHPHGGWSPPTLRGGYQPTRAVGGPLSSSQLAMLRPHSPTVRVGPTPYKGWAHLQGGQRSVSLEYQTCTSAYLFDTLVTGKACTTQYASGRRKRKIKVDQRDLRLVCYHARL